MVRVVLVFVMASLLVAACSDAFEYSPNQIHDDDTPRDLNLKNLDVLQSTAPDDTLTIIFTGDSQQFYDEVELFVKKANQIPSVDFVLLAGDISDFGLLNEFEWIVERLNGLKRPYFGVIGNHDVVANGEEVFKRMFGPVNYSFVYDSVKFILHNTNSREYITNNVPDLEWLENELRPHDAVSSYIAVSHVPPFSDDFNDDLEDAYRLLFHRTPGFLLSLHGHIHKHTDGYHYSDGVRYMTSDSFGGRNLILLKIVRGNVFKQVIPY